MATRTLHVRCGTWEQVEAFFSRKLRRGKLLSMRVPFSAEIGSPVMLGLELPNQVVVAIPGTVHKSSPIEGEAKTWIEVELNINDDILSRIKGNASELVLTPAPTPPAAPMMVPMAPAPRPPTAPPTVSPSAEQQPATNERALFQQLTAELRRTRQLSVHEVLGVERDADASTVRAAWMRLIRKHHPDLVARNHAPAITHLAEELTILCNRAYDRLRVVLVAEGRATAVGSLLQQPAGWLVGFDDISSADLSAGRAAKTALNVGNAPIAEAPARGAGRTITIPPVVGTQGQGGDAFESRARSMLGDGHPGEAQEVLAAALCVYPRSRPLRSLYYVASAMAALDKGEVMLATSQLETALAHHEHCVEAARILDELRRSTAPNPEAMRRLFR